uniref:Uncharacterized protein n=1 Tax=viral metagenome TaxID=1070528 RepID=A0A6C0JW66_9ZZZZ
MSTLKQQRLESYVQDEIQEWQIFNTDFVDTYKLACKVIKTIKKDENIKPYILGYDTLGLLLDHYTCDKVFAFENKDYAAFGTGLLRAYNNALEDRESDDEE